MHKLWNQITLINLLSQIGAPWFYKVPVRKGRGLLRAGQFQEGGGRTSIGHLSSSCFLGRWTYIHMYERHIITIRRRGRTGSHATFSMKVSIDIEHNCITPVKRSLGHSKHICDCPICDRFNETIHQSQTTTTESCVPPRYVVVVVVTGTSWRTKWSRQWSNMWQWWKNLSSSYWTGQARSHNSCSFLWLTQDRSHIYPFIHWKQTTQLLCYPWLYFLHRKIQKTSNLNFFPYIYMTVYTYGILFTYLAISPNLYRFSFIPWIVQVLGLVEW